MVATLKKWLVDALVVLLCFEGRKSGRSRADIERVARRELSGVSENIDAYFHWLTNETAIQSDRLARRFDLGLALNESANRAIAEKKALAEPRLTDKQLAALKVQKEYLQRVVRNS